MRSIACLALLLSLGCYPVKANSDSCLVTPCTGGMTCDVATASCKLPLTSSEPPPISCPEHECPESQTCDEVLGYCRGPVAIPGGVLRMGSELETRSYIELRMHTVGVLPFFLDWSEVTVDQFKRCRTAEACDPPVNPTWEGWTQEDCNLDVKGNIKKDREQHPMNCVTRAQASQFCAWRGMRLPTEAEWEYAARGSLGSQYPWGSWPPQMEVENTVACWGRGKEHPTTCKVGRYLRTLLGQPNPTGLADMAGNVWEFVSDDYCDYSERRDTLYNCTESPIPATHGILRGGSFYDGTIDGRGDDLRTTVRVEEPLIPVRSDSPPGRGFRCARSAP